MTVPTGRCGVSGILACPAGAELGHRVVGVQVERDDEGPGRPPGAGSGAVSQPLAVSRSAAC